ncbi:ABC transporter substrate-binding protein [Roseicyclus sp. F158]|uniref:ABC transporter substrate-binding protein n=1 Tax=Tropicimonas omnivorans TaxID=3075590 RepID=A0ABU3DHD9_9RHOB|nr:ABC transporter substrate-binding protein [Roseicyclus sp. F158]MDT0683137.1 ABC transporter substrate-binding protein [Roseicyclus sp. F158]
MKHLRLYGAAAASILAITGAQAQDFSQAPALTAMVEAGDLPPVEDRLPASPEVVEPLERAGTYGGVIRFGLRGSSDHNHILRLMGPQGLTRWDPEYTEVIPNLAESFEANEDATEFTFRLREGLKWSDGEPFDADDVMFNVEDLLLNEEFGPTPVRFTSGNQPLSIEKIDDLTVKITFAAPYGTFLQELAGPLGQYPTLYAKHYCQQFHPTYADDIDQKIDDAGAGDWQTLFLQTCGDIEIPARWGNPDRPTMDPWIVTEPYTGAATQVRLERNPYFWQVDTEGNQLPYIDALSGSVSQDVESLLLSIIGGNIDWALRHIDTTQNRPVLYENMESGGYRMIAADPRGGTQMTLDLNLMHPDEGLRELFNERDFRVALSLGIDRQAIIDTVFLGVGTPWQIGDFEGSAFYNERLSTQYTEHDPEEANRLLDELGLERGDDGIRRMDDGRPVRFQVDVIPTYAPDHVDQLGLIEQQWEEIGVDMEVNPVERTFFFERANNANQHDAAVWPSTGPLLTGTPDQIIPISDGSRWGIPWFKWYSTSGVEGEEPPASVKKRLELYDEARATTDPEVRAELLQQINEIAADEFEIIGIAQAMVSYGIANEDLVNVPDTMPNDWIYPTPAPTLLQTWFYDDRN